MCVCECAHPNIRRESIDSGHFVTEGRASEISHARQNSRDTRVLLWEGRRESDELQVKLIT